MARMDRIAPFRKALLHEARPHGERQVLFLLLPHVHVLDLGGAMQVFYEANAFGAPYRVRHVGVQPTVVSAQGLHLAALEPLPEVDANSLVIVPGFDSARLDALPTFLPAEWLSAAHSAGATICSICSGAFALAAAGLLDGRQCTTHWKLVERLQRRFPRATVLRDRLFVKDDGVYSSAGLASGIDLSLAIVEAQHGPLVAARVARELVIYVRRNGSRDQRSVFLDYRTHLHPGVHQVQDWLIAHPAASPTLEELAAIGSMSARHLTRRFRELTGISLKAFVHELKVEVASSLLCDPTLTVETVAARCGFADARQLRRLWQRHYQTTPTTWRERQLNA